jgi:hypothetical protein
MSCYTKHLEELFLEIGFPFTKENKKVGDALIRKVLKMSKADCPDVWKKLKTVLADKDKKKSLIKELKKAV